MAEEWLKFIPLDKSWLIRMGILDLMRGYGSKDIVNFLNTQENLGGDVNALKRVAESFDNPSKPFDVGESGTIYRFVRFYTWKKGINRAITARGTLPARVEKMCQDPELVNWPLEKLLTLEGGTTQWATMAILLGNNEKLQEVPFYLQKTYDSLKHWQTQRILGKKWIAQTDSTLTTQAREYISLLTTAEMHTSPTQLGDCDLYCFIRAFNGISAEEGKEMWPQIQYHESNRIKEMERTLKALYARKIIHSDDHRAVQANAMLIQSLNIQLPVESIRQRFDNPECVNKTWPKFWEFLDYCKKNYSEG